MARSKSKQKVKRHRRNQRWLRKTKRQKAAKKASS